MNKLEEQLDYLHYQIELRTAKSPGFIYKFGAVNAFCLTRTERFINYSDNPYVTRAVFISTWLIGYDAFFHNKEFYKKYPFVLVLDRLHDLQNPSWLAFYRHEKEDRTFYDEDLIGEYFSEALKFYLEECSNHHLIYPYMKKNIKGIDDEKVRGRLLLELDCIPHFEEVKILFA